MAVTISICNQKGGVGKTTTTINLAAALAHNKKTVLVLDIDVQANATKVLCTSEVDKGVIHFVKDGTIGIDELVYPTEREGIFIIPNEKLFNGEQISLSSAIGDGLTAIKKFRKLLSNETIQEFDYILIDVPPTIGMEVGSALYASDYYLVPTFADSFSIDGLKSIVQFAQVYEEDSNLQLLGVLVSKMDKRLKADKKIVGQLQDVFGDLVFEATIPANAKHSTITEEKKTLFDVSPGDGKGVQDYLHLAEEVIERTKVQEVSHRTVSEVTL